jgi:uncharacterized protein YjbJ (UPF0337 family)
MAMTTGSIADGLQPPARRRSLFLRERSQTGAFAMNKDRIAGSAKQAAGAIEEAAGKTLGDAKLAVEGRNKKTEGKIQNAVGGAEDVLKEAAKT